MIRKTLATKIITAAISGSLLLSTTVLAYNPDGAKNNHTIMTGHKGFRKPNLQSFVEEKIITQEQANKIEEFLKKRAVEKHSELEKLKDLSKEEREKYFKENYKSRPDIFGDLVSSKIITQDQANKIKESISRRRENKLQNVLKNEVSKGTISQEQLDKINKFIKDKKEAKRLEREKVSSLPENERKAYLESSGRHQTDLLTELVSAEIITEKQKESLSKVLPSHPNIHQKPGQ